MNKAQNKFFRTLSGIFQKAGAMDSSRVAHQIVIRLTEAPDQTIPLHQTSVGLACQMIGIKPTPQAIKIYLTAQSQGGKKR